MKPPATPDAWRALRAFTPARIALGRVGDSLPTTAMLEFGLAHAQARDAVHVELDVDSVHRQLAAAGCEYRDVQSAAGDRAVYLRRPDLGRRLADADRERLRSIAATTAPSPDRLVIVLADGLSAVAVERHAVPVIQALLPHLGARSIAPVVVARQARVALGDEVGELLGAGQVVVMVGERPGLSSHDSLGLYFTHRPRVGRTDADRNCLSNVRDGGLGHVLAAERLAALLAGARRLGASGVQLKDESLRAASIIAAP